MYEVVIKGLKHKPYSIIYGGNPPFGGYEFVFNPPKGSIGTVIIWNYKYHKHYSFRRAKKLFKQIYKMNPVM